METNERHQEVGRQLCALHAAPLIAVVWLMLGDTIDPADIVADTIASASRTVTPDTVETAETRQQLVRSVFYRCRGILVSRERFAPSPEPARRPSTVVGPRDADIRATVALTVFGQHDLMQAAAVLRLAPAAVLDGLRAALAIASHAVNSEESLRTRKEAWLTA